METIPSVPNKISLNDSINKTKDFDYNFDQEIKSTSSQNSIDSPHLSKISNGFFPTDSFSISVLDNWENLEKSDKISINTQIFESCDVPSILDKGFINNDDEETDEENSNRTKVKLFKEDFENLLIKCDYYENITVKNKINEYLLNVKIKLDSNFSFKNIENSENALDLKEKTLVSKENTSLNNQIFKRKGFFLIFHHNCFS